MKKYFYLLICCFTLCANAQTNSIEFNTEVEGMKQLTLKSNGLKILLIPDNSMSNVVVNVVYEVGSRHEGYGETGMAHLLEHMLFRSCKNFTDIKKAIADKGAFANGQTSYDRTDYFEILSATDSNLNWALAMEADRMVNAKILQSELDAEFSVVRNEFEIGENYPSNILNERIQSAMYIWHNYGKSVIGSKEDIERVKAERLRAFYQKYYQPDNATLIIAGKFDEKKAKEYIQNYFSVIPKPTRVLEPTYTVEPPQDGMRYVELKRNGDMQYIGFAYHTPCVASTDYAANDAIVEVLTNNPSGILYKKIVETKLASNVSGYTQTSRDPGSTYLQIDIPTNKDAATVEKALFSVLNNIDSVAATITKEDVERAKNSLLKYWEGINNNTQRLATSLADIIGAGDWRLWYKYRDDVEKLSLEDVQKTLKKYYHTSNLTWGKFIPEKTNDRVVVAEVSDINAIIKDYKGKTAQKNTAVFSADIDTIIAKTKYFKTTNGAKYAVLVKPAKSDIININIRMNLGSETSLQNTANVNEVLADLLQEGTKTKTKAVINDALDKLKSELRIFGGKNNVNITIKTPASSFSETMRLLGDMLRNPKLSEVDFQKIIGKKIGEYEESQSDPSQVAFTTIDKLSSNYPKSHPLYVADTKEDIQSLKNLKLSDLSSYFNNFYGGNNVVASFVGACNTTDIMKAMQDIFGKWNAKTPYTQIEEKYFEVAEKTQTVQIPDKTNAACAGNINISMSKKDADYPAVFMANELLGGGAFLSSRIPNRLREKEGMSYGAGSFFDADDKYKTAGWGLYAFFNPIYKERLDSALHEEINKAIDKGFTEDELQKSKVSWLQGEQTQLGMDNYLAFLLKDYLENNKDLKEKKDFQEKIKSLSLKQVNDAMKKYFDTKKLVLIYAGDFTKK